MDAIEPRWAAPCIGSVVSSALALGALRLVVSEEWSLPPVALHVLSRVRHQPSSIVKPAVVGVRRYLHLARIGVEPLRKVAWEGLRGRSLSLAGDYRYLEALAVAG